MHLHVSCGHDNMNIELPSEENQAESFLLNDARVSVTCKKCTNVKAVQSKAESFDGDEFDVTMLDTMPPFTPQKNIGIFLAQSDDGNKLSFQCVARKVPEELPCEQFEASVHQVKNILRLLMYLQFCLNLLRLNFGKL